MKRYNVYSIYRNQMYEYFMKRKINSHIRISEHFIKRYVERRIEPKSMNRCFNQIASNICQIIYSFEAGKPVPTIQHESLTVKLDYFDNKVHLMTCFDKKEKY